MKTSVNLPFSDSLRRVSFKPNAEKNFMVASRFMDRIIVWRKINSPSFSRELYVSGGRYDDKPLVEDAMVNPDRCLQARGDSERAVLKGRARLNNKKGKRVL